MARRGAAKRAAALVLGIVLVIGVSQHEADEDDLRRGLTPGQWDAPRAIVNDNAPGDPDNLARQTCSLQPADRLHGLPGCPQALSLARGEAYPPFGARKLYDLKTVLLI